MLAAVLMFAAVGLSGPVAGAAQVPTLVTIRAAHHPGFDRIVFEFQGPRPKVAQAYWAKQALRLDPSDRLAHVQGRARIKVVFRSAVAHELEPPYRSTALPHRRAYDLPNIAHVVQLGDTEGVVSHGIGLMKKTRILRTQLLRSPTRFVIDVATAFPKRSVKVFFVDEAAFASGAERAVVAVQRRVPRHAKARGALLRLWAGPTRAERRRDLVFVDSGTTGYQGLRIKRNGVARLTLRGPCDAQGAAVTVADQIMPTLKSRPAIEWVKIHDRDGTRDPWGKSDSLPVCLQP
jgi:hypothetical protein